MPYYCAYYTNIDINIIFYWLEFDHVCVEYISNIEY